MSMNIVQHLSSAYRGSDILIQDTISSYSVDEIKLRCQALSEYLTNNNIQCFALYGTNSVDWIIADLVCQALNIAVLPLPTFFSNEQIDFAIKKCPVQAIISDSPDNLSTFIQKYGSYIGAVPHSKLFLTKVPTKNSLADLPVGTGKITFTSGSTGQPKGVCLDHNQQLIQAAKLASYVDLSKPKHLCVLPLSTLLENIAGVYAPLLAGGQVIVPSLAELGFSGSTFSEPKRLLNAISTIKPESLILVPQLLSYLTSAISLGWQPPTSLKFIAVGGGKVSPDLLRTAAGQGLPVYEGYGLSECGSVVSLNLINSNHVGSCGRPLPGLDLSFNNGEVSVSGNSMLGYIGEPNSWNQASIKTGDLGELDAEGYLHINGRCKNVLISSFGRNISPEWVESELMTNLLISEAIVIGDAKPYCTAILSLRTPLDDADLAAYINKVNAKLPDYAQIKHWHVASQTLSAMPDLYTENGKPKRDAINRAFAEQIETLYQSSVAA